MSQARDRLRIVPLGGLGEIGMNCLALSQGDDIVIIDCGTRFPTDDCGVDVIHPSFEWLFQHRSKFRGVFLTHGHEDHIGALPYLLREMNVPVWGPRHALKLCSQRLAQHGLSRDEVTFHEVSTGERVSVASFEFEPLRVSHSIVEATALAIGTQAGTVLHTGDFKFDPRPSDGEVTDEHRLEELGDEGVALLLSDSTNVDELGEAGSEHDVKERLHDLIDAAKERVFVALFASNVQRLISLGRVAEATGRRITALGTSLQRHIEIAEDLGFLKWPKGLLLPAERARTFPRSELLVLASGTQAEPGSAMWRLAQGTHRFLDVEENDTVIFSSRVIPGHERHVNALICDLLRRGAKLEWGRRAGTHTSGHACRAEQQKMIELVRPQTFIPVHGTLHHLVKHAELARAAGIAEVKVIENGASAILSGGRLNDGPSVPSGDVHVGYGRELLDSRLLQRRKELSRGGHLIVVAVCDLRGRLLRAPSIDTNGVGRFDDDATLADELVDVLQQQWTEFDATSLDVLKMEARRFVGQWVETQHRLRPVVTIVLTAMKR